MAARYGADCTVPNRVASLEVFVNRRVSASIVVGACLLSQLFLATPASASTQTVGFRVGSWHCPKAFGLRSLNGVHVFGTDQGPNIGGEWSGSTTNVAYVSVTGVPSGGGKAHVVLSYSCWGSTPTPAEGDRWIYGSGTQPTYTL